ncbi:MAG: hypothetical protein R6V37_04635 [Psychroflexus maritimus]
MKKLISSTLILIAIIACSPLQRNNNSSSSLNGFETHKGVINYFVNDSVDQFFVKPLKFKSKDFEIQPDFTFRTGDHSDDITVNFSIFSNQPVQINEVERIIYASALKNIKKMYVEKKSKKKVESRFSAKIDKTSFLEINTDQSWTLEYKGGKKIHLRPNNKTKKTQSLFQFIVIN